MIHHDIWYCVDCEHTFNNPIDTREGGYPEEPTYVCPFCHSNDYVLADYCIECETVMPDTKLKYGLCEDCLRNLVHEHGVDFILGEAVIFDEFAWWMRKRIKDRSVKKK